MEQDALTTEPTVTQRLDQWLCFSRLVKSRTLAQALIARGKVRVNRQRVEKPGHVICPGDVLTLSMGPYVRVFEVLGAGARRGPASEAQHLYRQIGGGPAGEGSQRGGPGADPAVIAPPIIGQRDAGSGRPTKRDRRHIARLKDRPM